MAVSYEECYYLIEYLSFQENYNPSIAALLLDSGAHICAQDANGVTPLDILGTHPAKLNVMKYINLKCLAVNVIRQKGLSVDVGQVPKHCLQYYQEQL